MVYTKNLLQHLKEIQHSIEQAAREIYYAKSLINPNEPAQANLDAALRELGIQSPKDVYLSPSILDALSRK